ncbi:MAG TPA: exonuclease domain-containing protein, partial [Candidatus Binatia bacterium]|nr:exonuclease domain-containing protein [Candidatus Binatia bacterium]
MENLLEKPLGSAPLVVLDTETTGLSPAQGHRVVEVAAVRLQGWQQVESFDALVNPGRPMDAGASRVN